MSKAKDKSRFVRKYSLAGNRLSIFFEHAIITQRILIILTDIFIPGPVVRSPFILNGG